MRFKHALAATIIAGAAVLGLSGCAPTTQDTTGGHTCHVDSKDHTVNSSGDGIYRVYSDCGVFNVEDAFFLGKFNSADIYASIRPGHDYLFTTYGFRNGFFSWFPNITEAVEVTK